MTLLDSVFRALKVASDEGCDAALVGGLAVSVRAEPRFTRDADIVVSVDTDMEAESLVGRFVRGGYRLGALLEQSGVGRLSGARLVDPEGVEVDVLTASSGIETEVIAGSDLIELTGSQSVKVARTGHLIALKLLSVSAGRETDAADLRSLAKVAEESEWEAATEAVALIEERGFHRGRDLRESLRELREHDRVSIQAVEQ